MKLLSKYFCDYHCDRLIYISILLLNIIVFPVYAGEWRVVPSLNINERYTDNFRLGGITTGNKGNDEFITQINPSIFINGNARRYRVDVNYLMNNLIYANNSEFNRIRHQLNANGTVELIQDRFFIDGRAMILQQNASLLGSQGLDNANPLNRRNVSMLNISPYYRHRFGDFATAELRYTHGEVNTSGGGLRDSSTDNGTVRLNSSTAFRDLQWGFTYNHTEIHRNQLRTIALERSTVLLRYMLTPQFSLVGTGGYERNSFISVNGRTSSPTWTVGFSWIPNERTEFDFAGGQRIFGDTYLANFSHRTRLTTWSASYNEDITTFGQQNLLQPGAAGAIPSGGILPQLLLNTLTNAGFGGGGLANQGALLGISGANNFFTNRLFLQRSLQAFMTINGSRNTVVFRGFNISRQAYTGDEEDDSIGGRFNSALNRNTVQTGGGVSWIYRLSPLMNFTTNYTFTRINFTTSNLTDINQIMMVSLNKRFSPNLFGEISYFHNRRDSERINGDFSSNNYMASLSMNF